MEAEESTNNVLNSKVDKSENYSSVDKASKQSSTSSNSQTPQILRLQMLCNKYGNFKVARAWRDSKGEMLWSKHRGVMECWESEWGINFLGIVNNRQILPCEIVLDLDEKPTIEKLNWICDKLDILQEHYIAYFTGSKGYHIHIKDAMLFSMNKNQKEEVRLKLIEAVGADIHKKNEVMIALENAPHWKTGKIKTEIRRSGRWADF